MELVKANWTTDGNSVNVVMPLTKIDKENRIVSGFASLDNADSQGDVITQEANRSAFSRFRGNIREMHQKVAVGRMVSFREDTFFDKEGKQYNGVWVDVYVSKGAQDTWEKVLDGTLQGFSIGGKVIKSAPVFDKSTGSSSRRVDDYALDELSLVDNPANQFANIMSITKDVTGETHVTGMIADVESENVFYCGQPECEVAKTSSDDNMVCPNGHAMQNIGWYELDGGDSTEKVTSILHKYIKPDTPQESPANNEGGVEVATEEKPEPGSPVPAEVGAGEQGKAENEIASSVEEQTEQPAEAAPVQEDAENAAAVSEVDAADDLEKTLSDLQAQIDAGLEKNADAVSEALVKIDEQLAKMTETVEANVEALEKRSTELTEKFTALADNIDKITKVVDGLDAESAVRKSGDLGGELENDTLRKSAESKWNGRFLSVDSL